MCDTKDINDEQLPSGTYYTRLVSRETRVPRRGMPYLSVCVVVSDGPYKGKLVFKQIYHESHEVDIGVENVNEDASLTRNVVLSGMKFVVEDAKHE